MADRELVGLATDDGAMIDLLEHLGVDEIGVHLPGLPQRELVIDACARAGKTVVGLDARPRAVITADGVLEDGVVRCLKDEVDAAAPGAERVIVLRVIGSAPLAPTMDAYLDVHMIPGRDTWYDAVPR